VSIINGKNTHMITCFLGVLLLLLFTAAPAALGQETAHRKVIVLITDKIGLRDMDDRELVNFGRILKNGALGLMNNRADSLTKTNRASSYLTIGMGVRAYIPGQEVTTTDSDNEALLSEIRIADVQKIKKRVDRDYPNHTFGMIGETARQNGFRVAVVGNADTDGPRRETALLAADSQGKVRLGYTGHRLLVDDPETAWGHRTDTVRLLEYSLKALKNSDILFVDFGDTYRVGEAEERGKIEGPVLRQMRQKAMADADRFIGNLLENIDLNEVILIVLSPTASQDEILSGNRTLSPVIVYDQLQDHGTLTSGTTMRNGLIAGIDIGPTIFRKLGLTDYPPGFAGEETVIIPESENFDTVAGELEVYKYINRSRYIIHGIYVFLLLSALTCLYLPLFRESRVAVEKFGLTSAVMAAALAPSTFIIFTVLSYFGYSGIFYADIIISAIIIAAAGIMLSKNTERAISGIAWLSLITSGFIIIDLLRGSEYLLNTPLGFDNVFMGGRYYGINNDCMGILLGSTLFAMFYFFEKTGINKYLRTGLAVLVMGTVILSMTPGFGANVGGTIAAMSTGVITVMVLVSQQPVRKGKILFTVAIVFIVEIFVAYMDYLFGSQTHAGKVIGALLSQGFGDKFIEVLMAKLRLFAVMLVVPPWNIFLASQIYLFYRVRTKTGDNYLKLREAMPVLEGFTDAIWYGGLVAFAFNDTGTIATAMMFTYLTLPVGILLNKYISPNKTSGTMYSDRV